MKVSTSVMCMDYKDMQAQIQILNGFTDAYHWDIMDGHYVPNLTLNMDMIESLRDDIEKPIHAHLMVMRPQDFVQRLVELRVDEICLHLDTITGQAFRLIEFIKDSGVGVGIVLNPIERADNLEYVIERLDSITVMTVDPGFAGQKFIGRMTEKIAHLSELKTQHGYNYEIEIDGGVNAKTLAQLMQAGGERFVIGTSGLFGLAGDLRTSIEMARRYIPFKKL